MTYTLGITILMVMSYVTCQPKQQEHPIFQDPANTRNQMFQVQPNTVFTKTNPAHAAAEQIQAFIRQQSTGAQPNLFLQKQANIQAQRQVEQAQRFPLPPQLSGSSFPTPFVNQGPRSAVNLLHEGQTKQAEIQANNLRDQHELQREAAIKASEWQLKAVQEQRASQEKAIQAQRDFQKQALEAAAKLQLEQQNHLREIQQRNILGLGKRRDTSINFNSPQPPLAGMNGLIQSLGQNIATSQSPRSPGLPQFAPIPGVQSSLGQISQITGRGADRGLNSIGQIAQNARGFSSLGQHPLSLTSPFTGNILDTAIAQQRSQQTLFQPHEGSLAMLLQQRSAVPPQIQQGVARFSPPQQGLTLPSSLQPHQASSQGASQLISSVKQGLNQLSPHQESELSSLINLGLNALSRVSTPKQGQALGQAQALGQQRQTFGQLGHASGQQRQAFGQPGQTFGPLGQALGQQGQALGQPGQVFGGQLPNSNGFADETIRQIQLMNLNTQNSPLTHFPLRSPVRNSPIVFDYGLQSFPSRDRSVLSSLSSSLAEVNPFSSHDTVITLPPTYSFPSIDERISYPESIWGF